MIRQKTLKAEIGCVGIGLHSGKRTRLTLKPADIGTGIVFSRVDLPGSGDIPALWSNVVDTTLCSRIANRSGASVATVEHLMAALAGLEIDNCRIELDGPEVPAMDGSAAPFVFLIDCAGVSEQAAPRRAIQVLKRIVVGKASKSIVFDPEPGFSISCTIDFDSAAIARQSLTFGLDGSSFRDEIARARTFGFAADVAKLRAAGLARGGSLENAVVIEGDRVLNAEGVRFADEFVRHKVLDSIGDFYLAGAPLLARVQAERAGHELNNLALRTLFDREDAWRYVELDGSMLGAQAATLRPRPQLVAG
jgi:UDP-3-O-[3-hydroxymyristoyl] N-acetylglucosamine deacetylase